MDQHAALGIIDLCIFSTGFFAVVMSLGNAILRKKNLLSFYSLGLYLSVGLAFIFDYINHGEYFRPFPHFAYANDCLEFFMGAFFYHFFRTMLFPKDRRFPRTLILFVPGLVNLALYMPFFLMPASYKATHYPIALIGNTPLAGYYGFVNRYVELWVVICMGLFILRCGRFYASLKAAMLRLGARSPFSALLRYFTAWIFAMTLFFLTNFVGGPVAQRLVILGCSMLAISLPFMLQKHDAFFATLREDVSPREREPVSRAPGKSKILGLDVGAILTRLDRLMGESRLYGDPELTLQTLAHRLDIKPWQLSEILNQELGANFRSYVNERRLAEVRTRLLAEPDRAILEIAFDCGFNSKATFNAAFTRAFGVTPSEYRKQG